MNRNNVFAVKTSGVAKAYGQGATRVRALEDVSLEIAKGSFAVIRGRSGSGKSTLLNLVGCLDAPDAGELNVLDASVVSLDDESRTRFRAKHIGFVFQGFHLIPVMSALENVEYPLQLCEPNARRRREYALDMLNKVGLADQAKRRPAELSGGQCQRVAIARALVKKPALVLADEPTANLDRHTGAELIELMRGMQRDSQMTFIFSSHDPQLIEDADQSIQIEDGRVQSSFKR